MYSTIDSTLIVRFRLSYFHLIPCTCSIDMLIFQMTTAEQARIDEFRAKIEQRKACEKKAFDTCMQLIETDRVENDVLINSVMFKCDLCLLFISICM